MSELWHCIDWTMICTYLLKFKQLVFCEEKKTSAFNTTMIVTNYSSLMRTLATSHNQKEHVAMTSWYMEQFSSTHHPGSLCTTGRRWRSISSTSSYCRSQCSRRLASFWTQLLVRSFSSTTVKDILLIFFVFCAWKASQMWARTKHDRMFTVGAVIDV